MATFNLAICRGSNDIRDIIQSERLFNGSILKEIRLTYVNDEF